MNILYTITAYPPFVGGAQLQFHMLAKHLLRSDAIGVAYQWDEHRTDWLRGTTTHAPPADEKRFEEGVPVRRIAPTADQRAQLRFAVSVYPLLQGYAIRRIAAALLPHLNAAAEELLPGKPDIVHNSRIGREGITAASLAYARRLDVPFVLTPNHHHHWRGWFYRHYIRMYREADAVTVYTEYEKATLMDLGVLPERIHVIGVGPILSESGDGAAFRARLNLGDDTPIVLFLGQMYAYKHYDWLLDAMPLVWRKVPDAHLVLIGPQTEESKKRLATAHDSRIHSLGTVDLQQKTDALAGCDLLCVPSEKESFGTVYLEAWRFCKPIIGGTAPASQTIIKESGGGFYGSTSPRELADQLLTLLEDADLRELMGNAGLEFAELYTWAQIIARLESLYRTLKI